MRREKQYARAWSSGRCPAKKMALHGLTWCRSPGGTYLQWDQHSHIYYGEAMSASSSLANPTTTPTAPKISSHTIFMSGLVLMKIVGWMKYPSISYHSPPWCTVAPSFLPDSMETMICCTCHQRGETDEKSATHVELQLGDL